jgi:hypothetical protein
MKHERPAGGRSETAGWRVPSERTTRFRPPRLVLELPIEGKARLRINADSYEDEIRFRVWLRRALIRRESLSESLRDWLDLIELEEDVA